MRFLKRLICYFKGHTFKLPDVENFSGGILHLLNGQFCSRCGREYADLVNSGEVG